MAYSLGVDLGTTFVAAALCRGAQTEMVTLGTRAVVMPAAVCVGADGNLLCGEVALRQAAINPEGAALGFKRRLGDPVPVRVADTFQSPTQLLGVLLREVLRVVTETEGVPPEAVVLTHPANWGPYRRGLFEEVAVEAGLGDEVPTVTEPVAAAAHYAASRELPEGEIVAVYDLGGGTFDVSVLRARPEHVEILGEPEGIERLGGIDFDDALVAHIDHVSGHLLSSLDPRDSRAMMALARLRQDCVLAKEALSVDSEAVIPVFLPDQAFDVTVTREQFEDLIRARIESTLGALERTLRSSHLTPADIDTVLLVGGSSRIPLVARMVADAIGAPTAVDTHPKYAVALGAAGLAPGARRAPMAQVAGRQQVATEDQIAPAPAPAEPPATAILRVTPRRPLAEPAVPAEPVAGSTGTHTLCVISEGQRFQVQPTERFVIGRDAGVQLKLTNPHVSRQHAVLETVNGAWLFTDTSRNGSFLDGRAINQLVVNDAVTLCLGDDAEGATVELIPDRPPDSPTDVTLHRMVGSRVRIGRQPDNDMVLDDPLISRRHAELRRTPQGWQLVDLSSSNGTFVNGRRVGTATLALGDVIGLGYGNYRFDGGWLVLCDSGAQDP